MKRRRRNNGLSGPDEEKPNPVSGSALMNKFPSAEGPVRYPTYLLSRRFGYRRLVDIICQADQKRNPSQEKLITISWKRTHQSSGKRFAACGVHPDPAKSTARMAASGIGGKGVSEIASPEMAVQAA
jgi:hypothetical protein